MSSALIDAGMLIATNKTTRLIIRISINLRLKLITLYYFMFKGSIVALITPFKNNKLDEENYSKLIHHHIKNGTNGIVPAGTTGESPTLSHEEHKQAVEICIDQCKKMSCQCRQC